MDALFYELFMRQVYQVGRRGKKGVDADIYRRLERAERAYKMDAENAIKGKPRLRSSSLDDLQYEYQKECNVIAMYVSEGIADSIAKYGHKFTEEEKSQLLALRPGINVGKDIIEKAIETASEILRIHNILAR